MDRRGKSGRFGDEDEEREIIIITPRDPSVVTPPTERQGPAKQSIFIFNPNQPPPPILATRFFTPPPWPENLEGENLTILPVVGPILALTEEQMETPPGFGRFVSFEEAINPARMERALERREVREEMRERGESGRRGLSGERRGESGERTERRERRRRKRRDEPILGSDTRENPTMDWPSGGGAE